MSGISSGIGLISGLPTAQLIDSLIAQASRPKDLMSAQLANLQTQRSSLLELNARLVSLQSVTARLKDPAFFNKYAAASSNESVLTATASDGALPGAFDLLVKSLVASHQMISGGYSDADTTPVGVGQLSIEVGEGRLLQATALGDLNGSAGVRRGRIAITDRAGNTSEIDLTAAIDVNEVLNQINTATEINVRASVAGNALVIEDLTGGTGNLSVVDINGTFAARDLGIAQTIAGDVLTGSDILYLSDSTPLELLNDGNGIRRGLADDFAITNAEDRRFTVRLDGTLADTTRLDVLNNGNGVRLGTIRITNRLGASGTIDLSGAQTIGDIRTIAEAAVDENGDALNVSLGAVGISGIGSLTIRDNNKPPEPPAGIPEDDIVKPELIVEDVTGYAARDLGIAGSTTEDSILGSGIHRVTTIGDVLRAINYADGNDGSVVASLTSNGLRLQDMSSGGSVTTLRIEALDGGRGNLSKAAADLGIEGVLSADYQSRDLLAGLNTVLLQSLNGGNGLELGTVSFQARDGSAPVTVDFTGAQTVQDIITRINESGAGIEASINAVGHGIALTDTTGQTLSDLVVTDVSGTLAADLGLAGTYAESEVQGTNLQLQYMTELTNLDGLNGGRGVREGVIQITNTNGEIFVVEIDDSQKTLGDILNTINQVGEVYGVQAAMNATGDGIAISDSNGGDKTLKIEDVQGGAAAEDLRIAKQATAGETSIDGSFEIVIEIDADDTLQDVAGKIRDASPDVNASVMNDGASGSPYRLSVTSGVTGKQGELLFDAGTTGLNMSTLVAARDAVVLVGGQNSASPIVISSSTNTLSGVVPGVEINLVGTSNDTVTVSSTRDIDRIASDLGTFVTNYNAVMDRIDELTSFDPDTEERGPLLSDSTVALVENRMSRAALKRFTNGPSDLQTLSSVGIGFGDGARLSFDEQAFRETFADNPEGVQRLFANGDNSIGATLDAMLEGLTNETDGVLSRRDNVLGDQVDDINDRIDALDAQLQRKREQLERQFVNLESVLAGMQSQQSALAQLASLAGN